MAASNWLSTKFGHGDDASDEVSGKKSLSFMKLSYENFKIYKRAKSSAITFLKCRALRSEGKSSQAFDGV
jgi:hypothetical protein